MRGPDAARFAEVSGAAPRQPLGNPDWRFRDSGHTSTAWEGVGNGNEYPNLHHLSPREPLEEYTAMGYTVFERDLET